MWIRHVSVDISGKKDAKNNKVYMNFDSHRIDFEYYSSLGWAGDYGTLTIYNLSIEEIRTLQNRKFGSLSVTLYAGYKNDRLPNHNNVSDPNAPEQATNIIFTGTITNVVGYKRSPEHVVHLYCIPESVIKATNIKMRLDEVKKGMTLLDALTNMSSNSGFDLHYYSVDKSILKYTFKKERVFHGTFFDEFRQICQEFSLTFSLQSNFISVYPDEFGHGDIVSAMSKYNKPIELKPEHVIGNPIAGIAALELSTYLNASIQPGMVLDITSLLGTSENHDTLLSDGVVNYNSGRAMNYIDDNIINGMSSKYYVKSLVHHGSTHSSEFQTDIAAVYGVNDQMGAIDKEWREWCTKAWY
ncbi:MAG: hypothetical protein EKE20_14755 [Candidatus Symbiopectobacterium sp. Dall1.0]|nr:hypothetical protein [Candidatus Symbiopectobacterium sp. Dall1.0]